MLQIFQVVFRPSLLRKVKKWASILLSIYAGVHLQAQEMIPGSGFLTTQTGSIAITNTTGEALSFPVRKSIIPSGTTWETSNKSNCFLSLSNGTSLALSEFTKVDIIDYFQHPFEKKQEGFKYEPSVSKLNLKLHSGQLVVASNKLSPLSVIRIISPTGTVRLHKGTCILDYNSRGLQIIAIDAYITYYYPDGESREFITANSLISISEASAKRQQSIKRQELLELDSKLLQLTEATEHSSRRVYYKANKKTGKAPDPVMVVRPEYYEQPSLRPYQFKE